MPAMKHCQYLFVKKLMFTCFVGLFCQPVFPQYYYRDILLPAQNATQQQLYKKNRVQQVTLLSFEADGSATEGFAGEIRPNNSYTQLKTITKTEMAGSFSLTAFYNFKGQMYKSVDSGTATINTYEYAFDTTGRLISAANTITGIADKSRQNEVHSWTYTPQGIPALMYYIKNGRDTTTIKFLSDEKGNIIEEESWWKNISKGKTYYYYDSLNRLTDIVRYNEKIQKLMPDYIFEYNDNGQLVQMINTQQGSSDYLIWKYLYDEKGLRTEERCYNKQKQLVGRIEYKYSFR